ncbi:hypothetical protein BGX38DRAFT_1202905, partial [Terfezia claveryi]
NREHCISRSISDSASISSSAMNFQHCMKLDTFADAWPCIEADPHNRGHRGIGMEMFNSYSSLGDPLFYLHHAWLDKRIRDITDTLKMLGVVLDATVDEVMDLKGKRLCVEYENLHPQGV